MNIGDADDNSFNVSDSFDFDVAISFLDRDREVAEDLNRRLKQRFRTFLYSEHQASLANTDGGQFFTDVFRQRANIAVILYRPEWGKTQWTAIERRAIEDRQLTEGDEFCFVIAMDLANPRPPFISRYRIWMNLVSFGVDATVSAITHKLTERGADARPETLEEHAKRVKWESAFQSRRGIFLNTTESRTAAEAEIDNLEHYVGEALAIIKPISPLKFELSRSNIFQLAIINPQLTMVLHWEHGGAPGLKHARFQINLYKGLPHGITRTYSLDAPKKVMSKAFVIDLGSAGSPVWKRNRNDSREISTAQLAEECVRDLLDRVSG